MARVLMKPSFHPPPLSHHSPCRKTSLHMQKFSPNTLGLKKEKLTHFRIYWHDVVGAPNATAIQITPLINNSTNGFGIVTMMDDTLIMGPKLISKLVRRAQGLYATSAQSKLGMKMAMNFAFMEGKYNGSTISILGRNTVFSKIREMPIIGGSGLFRFARGYVQARTRMLDLDSSDATVEYNCYMLHC